MIRQILRCARPSSGLRPFVIRRFQSTTSSSSSSSGFSLKGNPWVPYILLLSVVSSAVLKVMAVQQDMRVLEERTAARRSVLEDVLARLDQHERDIAEGKIAPGSQGFDVAKEIQQLIEKKDLDKTLEEILTEMESAEDEWIDTTPVQVTAAVAPEQAPEQAPDLTPQPIQPVQQVPKPSTSKFL
ncbi:uncharacterized protein SAPINGB_P002378 [Magnusiomyces paraingens]|uniref:Uncharacterized protein n=1 Tax=Magnusiomyces paraingens TaxID=2606893 RepID=A0A5E8BJE9_9ASCO|nr:uncharacterized protein SAPINGB_P002378 [Saprochaete ingens]VVT49657.1 unnamed protein product [Saprochaete ingens]